MKIGRHEFTLKKYEYGDYLDIIDKSTEISQDVKNPLVMSNKINTRNLHLYTELYSVAKWMIGDKEMPVTIENLGKELSPSEGMELMAECQKENGLTEIEEKN